MTAAEEETLQGASQTVSASSTGPSSSSDSGATVDLIDTPVGPHHRIITLLAPNAGPEGGSVTNRIIELRTGMNRLDPATGRWTPAVAEFEQTPEGGMAVPHARFQVLLAPDLNVQGAVTLTTPEGKTLRSSLAGLSIFDPASGESRLLARVQSAKPRLISPTEVWYENAFPGLADVRYRVGLDHLEQDIILRAPVQLPEGFSAYSRLQVLTEWYDLPAPEIEASVIDLEPDKALRAALKVPEIPEQTLIFGEMRIGPGRAFPLAPTPTEAGTQGALAKPDPSIATACSLQTAEGRTFLVESMSFVRLKGLIESLPKAAQARVSPERAGVGEPRQRGTAAFAVPPALIKRVAAATPGKEGPTTVRHRYAQASASVEPGTANALDSVFGRPGVVIDYTILSSQSNMRFLGTETYLVAGSVNLSGTTTWEGGSVIKYSSVADAKIVVSGPVTCLTDPYRPVICTSKDDNSAGFVIPGSTGSPIGGYGNPMLYFACSGVTTLAHFRFAHAWTAIGVWAPEGSCPTLYLRHSQIVNCYNGLLGYGTSPTRWVDLKLRNVLLEWSTLDLDSIGIWGYFWHCQMQQVTVREIEKLAAGDGNCTLHSVNGIFANIQSFADGPVTVTGDHNGFWPVTPTFGENPLEDSQDPFDPCGPGLAFLSTGSRLYYLAWADPALIDATLLAEMKERTCVPPQIRTEPVTASESWQVNYVARRRFYSGSLGYHYPAVDYVVSGVSGLPIQNPGTVLSLEAGVVVAVHGPTGFCLGQGTEIECNGTWNWENAQWIERGRRPWQRNAIVRYQSVMEQGNSQWIDTTATALIADAATSTSLKARIQHTDMVLLSAGGKHIGGGGKYSQLTLSHCALYNGSLLEVAGGASARTFGFTNTLFERVTPITFGNGSDAALSAHGRHNLFRNCGVNFNKAQGGGSWAWHENFFDTCSLWQYYSYVASSHNGYLATTPTPLQGSSGNDKILTSSPFVSGRLGRYYLATSSSLVNGGGRTADAAELYFYTTRSADQAPEGNTTVDIGLHYPPYLAPTVIATVPGAFDVDYYHSSKFGIGDSLIVAGYSSGAGTDGYPFHRIDGSGNVSTWSSEQPIGVEFPMLTLRNDLGTDEDLRAGSTVFAEADGDVGSINIFGTWREDPWRNLQCEGFPGGITRDQANLFGFGVDFQSDFLIVTTGDLSQATCSGGGEVYRVDLLHAPPARYEKILDTGGCLEGALVCPNDLVRYGPKFAGKLLSGAGPEKRVCAIAPPPTYPGQSPPPEWVELEGIVPHEFAIVPSAANQDLYFVEIPQDPEVALNRIDKIPRAFFANVANELVVFQSGEFAGGEGHLFLVRWNNAAQRFAIMRITEDSPGRCDRYVEHGAFAPLSL